MKKVQLVLLVMILLACCGCNTTGNVTSPNAPSSPSAPQTQLDGPASVELPLPSSKVFGLEGTDALLYDIAVKYYSVQLEDPEIRKHLFMPSLGVLDTYQTEDGSTCYLCRFRGYDYYNLSQGLRDLNHPRYSPGSGGYDLARFTIAKTQSGKPVCTEVVLSADGEGWAQSIRLICGPKKELARAIIENKKLPVTIRDITSADSKKLLDIYLDYYFR